MFRTFTDIIKDEPGVSGVHVSTAIGNEMPPQRRHRTFAAVMGAPKKPAATIPSTSGPTPVTTAAAPMTVKMFNELYGSRFVTFGDALRARGSFLGVTPSAKAITPPAFPYDPTFLSQLRGSQVPSFLWALTHHSDLPKKRVPLDHLVAIQDRVDPKDVAADEMKSPGQRPTVVKFNGVHYIADGHDRLTARRLKGKTHAKVRLHDMNNPVNPEAIKKFEDAEKSWEIPFEVRKADPDQRMIFGWASIVTKNGKMILDHQADMIPVEELEKAFYDYVLYDRAQGHMHSKIGVGRLIECMVFTKQKQDVLGIIVKDEDGSPIEGAWVGYLVDDEGVWQAHKRGELPAFSIGGAAVPIEVNV